MSAEVLRRAASLMRENAEAATGGADWTGGHYWIVDYDPSDPTGQTAMQVEIGIMLEDGDAEFFASWHPAVALAVAESVDVALGWFDPEDCTEAEQAMHDALLTVARAYLGEDS